MSLPRESSVRVVYAAALNRRATLAALGEALDREPYRAPPNAPVLHLKPANTWIGPGEPIPCPRSVVGLRMGGTIGLVIGRTARRVDHRSALDHVSQVILVNDVSIPYDSYVRPALRERCRDGFCPIGPRSILRAGSDPTEYEVVIEVDGSIKSRTDGRDLVRNAARLLADVTEFLTLDPDDVLLLGEPHDAPIAEPGQTVRITVPEIGSLTNPVVRES